MIPNPGTWLLPEFQDLAARLETTLMLPPNGQLSNGISLQPDSDGFLVFLPSGAQRLRILAQQPGSRCMASLTTASPAAQLRYLPEAPDPPVFSLELGMLQGCGVCSSPLRIWQLHYHYHTYYGPGHLRCPCDAAMPLEGPLHAANSDVCFCISDIVLRRAVQPSIVPDFAFRYGIQIGQAFGLDFGIGLIRDICFVSFAIV